MTAVLLGGIVGFWSAVVGVFAFDAPVLAGLLIWGLSGPVAAGVALAATVLHRPPPCEPPRD